MPTSGKLLFYKSVKEKKYGKKWLLDAPSLGDLHDQEDH